MDGPEEIFELQLARVLVLEDDYVLAQDIAQALEKAGLRVVGPFSNMVDALENMSELDAIDGAVIDIRLGDQDVYPLADALSLTGVPFMFLTVHPRDALPERFANVPHMMKPFCDTGLIQTLQAMRVERNY